MTNPKKSSLDNSDELYRCGWVTTESLARYHDEEWGVASHDGRHLFEMLVLEGAQARLSWSTILNKREGYRALLHDFDIDRVAAFSEDDAARLLLDPRIVRNRAKISATVANARGAAHPGGTRLVREFCVVVRRQYAYRHPTRNLCTSARLQRNLRRHKPCHEEIRLQVHRNNPICYAFMQATGMVNDHEAACFCRFRDNAAVPKRESAKRRTN